MRPKENKRSRGGGEWPRKMGNRDVDSFKVQKQLHRKLQLTVS